MNFTENVILSIYLNTRGFGYVAVDMPDTLLDYAVVTSRPVNNAQLLERIKKLIEFANPRLIIVRDATSTQQFKCCKRIQELTQTVVGFAEERKIPLYQYSREQVRNTFELWGLKTKMEIANQIAVWFNDLLPRLPKARKAWTEEDYNMGVFDAMALAVTHKYLSE